MEEEKMRNSNRRREPRHHLLTLQYHFSGDTQTMRWASGRMGNDEAVSSFWVVPEDPT